MRAKDLKCGRGMDDRGVVFAVAFVAAVGLLAAAGVRAADPPLPTTCTTANGIWTIEVTAGPCPVSSAAGPTCADSGQYTGIKYHVTGVADHVATVVTKYNTVSTATGNQSYDPCVGDPVTGLGKYSCHEKAVKLNPVDQTQNFWVVVGGQKGPVLQSVAAKKGSKTEACAIVGLGVEGVELAWTTSETVQIGPCTATLNTPRGGESTLVLTTESIAAGCELVDNGVPLNQVTITTPYHEGTGLQASEFSFVTEGSCCWSVVSPKPNGKLYTVCNTTVSTC